MTKLVGEALIKMDELEDGCSEVCKEAADDDSFVLPRTNAELIAMRDQGEVCVSIQTYFTSAFIFIIE